MYKSFSMELAGRTLTVDVNRVAKQANGAAFMHYGDTTVLSTATASDKPRDGIDFFPLSVEYEEKLYSVGKIPGGFNKREGKASENAILTSRVIPSRGQEMYLYDDKELERYRRSHTGDFRLQRYKGLGEMDPEQLWETTLDPERRVLKRVEIEDARMASEVTEMLMGSEVPPRKQFIYDHANEAEIDA